MSCEITNTYDLCVKQNETFKLPITLYQDDNITPINVSTWTFTGSIKRQFGEDIPLMSFMVDSTQAASGSLVFYLSADNTWLLSDKKYVYDIISNNTTVSPPETLRLMQGKISVNLGVTEP